MLTVGSLFSGIGGFDLGLERAGMRVIWQSEIDPYASAVLKKHWPTVPNHGDIRTIHAGNVERPDVLCGGFPCQDISNAGKRAGIDGERSGLWSEFARVIGELRPDYVLVENVAALLGRGLGRVLGDLATLGFDAEWHCIPASAVGAPHRRDRLWIIADAGHGYIAERSRQARRITPKRTPERREFGCDGAQRNVADSDQPRLEGWLREILRERSAEWFVGTRDSSPHVANDDGHNSRASGPREIESGPTNITRAGGQRFGVRDWQPEPDVGRVADGVPSRVDRLRSLGNAIVPQVAEIIGRAVVSAA